MNTIASRLSPSITKMIRMDHTHVVALAHRFEAHTPAARKKAIVESACLALQIHAQLEEEIFYPALQAVAADNEALRQARPEHAEMRRLIARLNGLAPDDAQYDATFHELIRDVLHHVADEETVLLPAAERLLADRLGELGAQMTKRRLELAGPRIVEIASQGVRAMPGGAMLVAGGLLASGYLLKRAFEHRRH